MKRRTAVMVLSLVCTIPLSASAQVHAGLIGGVNVASTNWRPPPRLLEEYDVYEVTAATLFGIGGVLDIGVGDGIALRFEPMYLQKGVNIYTTYGENAFYGTLRLSYLEVPLTVKMPLVRRTSRHT